MAKQLFKGFKQVLSGESFENGYVYFVREDASKEHGYLYFNGKKYGTTKEVYEALAAIDAISADTRIAALEAISADTRLDTIESDYLKEADKTELEEALESAITEEMQARIADDVADVVYDSNAKRIFIKYNDNTVSSGFSAADFIVDGMLSSVTYDVSAHTMTFIWNTDAGGKEITINLDDIISPYQADEQTIHLGANNTFSAIMDQAGGVASHSALTHEAEVREAADEELADAIEDVESALTEEEQARIAADEALEQSISSLTEEVIANEEVTAEALNELNDKLNELDGTKIIVGQDIPSGTTSGATITETLADIYDKLAHAASEFNVESSDDSLEISESGDTIDITLNREESTNTTVANGHIAILLNASGETYAQMYYDGNDVE